MKKDNAMKNTMKNRADKKTGGSGLPLTQLSKDERYYMVCALVAKRLAELQLAHTSATGRDLAKMTKYLTTLSDEGKVRYLLLALPYICVLVHRPSLPVTPTDLVRETQLTHGPGVRAVERASRLLINLVSKSCAKQIEQA